MTQQTMYPANVNSPLTELSAGINAVVTTIPVVDASVLPAAPNIAVIGSAEDAETILYTGKSGNSLTGVTRGFQGTAKTWGAGVKVARFFTAYDHDIFKANIEDLNLRVISTENWYAAMARQAIINGNFDIWQRGTSWTNPAAFTFTADRFGIGNNSADGGTFPANIIHSRQQLTSGDVANVYYFYRFNVDGAGSTYGANSFYRLSQKIEHGTRYLCGNGKKVTVSFLARSSIANKKLGIHLTQVYGTGGSPSAAETINGTKFTLTSVWAKYTFTFTTNTLVGKTFGSNNDDFLTFVFNLQWGVNNSAFVGDTVAETFVGAGNIDIAQVQVNAGDVAVPFQPRSFAEELSLCQRYYEKSYAIADAPGTITNYGTVNWLAMGTHSFHRQIVYFKVPKRITPTVVLYSPSSGITGKIQQLGVADVNGAYGNHNEKSFVGFVNNVSITNNEMQYHWVADAEI